MDRYQLNTIIERLCKMQGLNFRVVERQAVAAQTPALPAIVMQQPEFIGQQGRTSGRVTYAIKLLLVDKAIGMTHKERAEMISTAEQSLLQLLTDLSMDNQVALIKDIRIEAVDSGRLARHECGVEATAKVVTLF